MPKSNTVIDDGFSKPYVEPKRNETGVTESSSRIAEPSGRPERVDGLAFISPIDFERTPNEHRTERTAERTDDGATGDTFSESPKRRGRPLGSKNSPKPASVSSLKDALMMGNVFLMSLLSADEDWAADEIEAKRIADATEKLASFYTSAIDPKKMAWAEWIMAVGA